MRIVKKQLLAVLAISFITGLQAQSIDSSSVKRVTAKDTSIATNKWNTVTKKRNAGYKTFLVPGILIAYGAASLESKGLRNFNTEIKQEIWLENPHKKTTIDNYLQYSPAVAVYALNGLGIKGRNNFIDRSMIYFLSNVMMSATVLGVKKLTHELRPDGSDYYSFPSGHTAEAFASAEFLRQEYKNISPWYGIAGYVAASATGVLRMYNNKHWMSDVLAGAGVGIASTKLAYLIYPAIKKKFFKNKTMNTMVMPYYQSGSAGLAMVYHLK